MRFTRIIISLFIIALTLISSCEKENLSTTLIGKWRFHKFCNKNLSIGCVYSFNRDFNETITITDNAFTISYDDSIITTSAYHLSDTLIVYGQNEYAQQFKLRNDTLSLTDTCFACTYSIYIKE
jgi:hypothetical protein